jgi:hypothetical protein
MEGRSDLLDPEFVHTECRPRRARADVGRSGGLVRYQSRASPHHAQYDHGRDDKGRTRAKVVAGDPAPHHSAATRTTSATAAIVRTVDRVIGPPGAARLDQHGTDSRGNRSGGCCAGYRGQDGIRVASGVVELHIAQTRSDGRPVIPRSSAGRRFRAIVRRLMSPAVVQTPRETSETPAISLVTPAGFEPAISTLKGSRPGPG